LVNGFAALVPLEELRELNFTKQYGIGRDPEVIDILDTASKTKGVFMLFLILLFASAVNIGRKYGGKALSFCVDVFETGKGSGKGVLGRSKGEVVQCCGRSSPGLFGSWKQGFRSH